MVDIQNDLKDTEYFLLDMDGTVYIGDALIGNMDKTLDILRQKGKKIIYLTNNSSMSKDTYINKLKSLNLYRYGDTVYTSGMATAEYLIEKFPDKKVYLFGTSALKKEFVESGINLVEDEIPDICVMAFNTEMTYNDLCKLTKYVELCPNYIATHPDSNCPAPDAYIPDVGSFIQLVKESKGVLPSEIIGKPYTGMGDRLMHKYYVEKDKFIMVGDRLHTDIRFGNNCGFKTILVLSGETTLDNMDMYPDKPTYILESLNEVIKYI